MELGLCTVAGDVSLSSGFKKHLKYVSTWYLREEGPSHG